MPLNTYDSPTDVQGVLQQLQMRIQESGPEREAQEAKRNAAEQGYLAQLGAQGPSTGGALGHTVNNYLQRYAATGGRQGPAMTMIGAIGDTAGLRRNEWESDQARRDKAAGMAYGMADQQMKTDDTLLRSMLASTRGGANGTGGKWVQAKDDAGNLYWKNNVTGEEKVVPASKSGQWDKVQRQVFAKLSAERDPDALNKSIQFANSITESSPSGTTDVATQQAPQVPVGQPPQQGMSTQLSVPSQAGPKGEMAIADSLRKATALAQNPETSEQGMQQLQFLRQQYPQAQAQPSARSTTSGLPQMEYKDLRVEEREKAYGGGEGKSLEKERTGLTELAGKNSQLISQLNAMNEMYSNPGMPEGALGPYVQMYRSGLTSLGIAADPSVNHAQVFDALAKRVALAGKSADGTNLLPGAMSNYEDQLLQSMGPGLAGTREGNKLLIKLMTEFAKSNMRFAEEGSRMATENKDMLPPTWNARKERIMKEEQLRLKRVVHQLANPQ